MADDLLGSVSGSSPRSSGAATPVNSRMPFPVPRPLRRPAALALGGAAAALALAAGAGGQEAVFEGRYTSGFEVSALAPCGERWAGESWWVMADSAAWAGLRAALDEVREGRGPGDYVTIFVRVRGAVTDTGRYGHVGAYDRRLRVTELVSALPADSAACPGEARGQEGSGGPGVTRASSPELPGRLGRPLRVRSRTSG